MQNRNHWAGYLYILPAMIIVGVFTIYPLIRVFLMSFFEGYDFSSGMVRSYGPENYWYLAKDGTFQKAMKNTFLYVIAVTPITVGLALILAAALRSGIRFQRLFQTVFFLPYVTSIVAMGIVWSWIFHSRYGIINYFLSILGIEPVQWLNSPEMAMPSLIFFSIWKGLSFHIIIFLAGLQNINPQLYQAARIDEAPKRRIFFRITLPTLSPLIAYVQISDQYFESAFKGSNEIRTLLTTEVETAILEKKPADQAIAEIGEKVQAILNKNK